jgi:hypothetical protein
MIKRAQRIYDHVVGFSSMNAKALSQFGVIGMRLSDFPQSFTS